MTLLQRIVCATDLSPASLLALDVATAWSRRLDRKLEIVHVFDPAPLGPSAALPYPAWPTMAASRAIEREATKKLAELAEEKLKDIRHETAVISHPNAALGICDAVEATDLLIMGTRGKTGLERIVVGSVAEQTIRHAPCPVMAVRDDARAGAPKNVLVCTDFSEASMSALQLGGSVATAFVATITLLHVASKHQVDAPDTDADAIDAAARRELERLHRDHFPEPVRTAFVAAHRVADAIVEYASDQDVDLIVLATHGRTGLSRLTIGSVAEKVTRHAPCSVLVARTNPDEES